MKNILHAWFLISMLEHPIVGMNSVIPSLVHLASKVVARDFVKQSQLGLDTTKVEQSGQDIMDYVKRAVRSTYGWNGVVHHDRTIDYSQSGQIIKSIRCSEGIDIIACLFKDNCIKFFNNASRGPFLELNTDGCEKINCIGVSSDGRTFAYATHMNELKIYDVRKADFIKIFDTSSLVPCQCMPKIRTCNFSADGTKILTPTCNGSTYLWNLSGDVERVFAGTFGCFSPNGSLVVTSLATETYGYEQVTLSVFVANTGRVVASTIVDVCDGFALAMTPNQRDILFGSADGDLYIWRYLQDQIVKCYTWDKQACFLHINFTADCDYAATVDLEGRIHIWNLKSAKVAAAFQVDGALGCSFSSDGTMLYVPLKDGRVEIFQAADFEPLMAKLVKK